MTALPKRLLSIDVFRAVTMLLMIFVNDASGVKHIPEWIDHAKGNDDAMGFADTIFPAFLFIVGLSLPFAIKNKIAKGASFLNIAFYIVSRSAALLIMGFYHVNLEDYSTAAALPRAAWALIITVCFFLIWLDYPDTMNKTAKRLLIATGIAGLVLMAILYKGGPASAPEGMHPSWWGILGIIGWSYLVCSIIYFLTKGEFYALLIALIIFVIINIAAHTGLLHQRILVIGDGASVSLVMFGVIVSEWYALLAKQNVTHTLWLKFALTGVALIAGGLLLRPYAEGISKIRSTPAWVFICTGISILVFLSAIYLVDFKGKINYFKFIRPAGTSTLTCYLMPYFQVFLLELFHIKYPAAINNGLPGLLRSMLTAFILIWLVGQMEKIRLRLKI